MIEVVIVDDENLAREGLRHRLAAESDVEVVGEASDAATAREMIERLRPDLVLADIRMPGETGLDLANAIPVDERPLMIFVTAHPDHALDAFDARALDYLVKPVARARLRESLDRVRQLLRLREQASDEPHAGRRAEPAAYLSRLPVRRGQKHVILHVEEIDAFEAASNYVRVWVGDDSWLLRATLVRLLDELDPAEFVRIHRSTIVNVQSVREVRRENADFEVTLTSGKTFRMSRTYRANLLDPA